MHIQYLYIFLHFVYFMLFICCYCELKWLFTFFEPSYKKIRQFESHKYKFHKIKFLSAAMSKCWFSVLRRNISNLIIFSSKFVNVRMVISVMLGHSSAGWGTAFLWTIFGCGKAISLMWGLNSAPLVSHASLLTTRPSNPSKVLSAIRLWAENCGFCHLQF